MGGQICCYLYNKYSVSGVLLGTGFQLIQHFKVIDTQSLTWREFS